MPRLPLILTLLASFFILVACRPVAPKAPLTERKINVVSTTGMVNDIVLNVGGDRVEAIALMGPGIDPHLYRPTAGDVQKLNQADIVFYNGLELEGRMNEVFEKMARDRTPTVAVAESVPVSDRLAPEDLQKTADPHIWFDPLLWINAVEAVRDALIDLDPASQDLYQANAEAFIAEIEKLHQESFDALAPVPTDQRVLVTAHDAFAYFGDRYNFEVLGIQGTSTSAEAAASQIVALADTIAQRKIKAVFVESSVPPATIESLRQAVRSRGWEVQLGGELFSDAMGDPGTPEGTYLGMVRHNIKTIVQALL